MRTVTPEWFQLFGVVWSVQHIRYNYFGGNFIISSDVILESFTSKVTHLTPWNLRSRVSVMPCGVVVLQWVLM